MDPVSHSDNESPPPIGDIVRQLLHDISNYIAAERAIYSVQATLTRRAASWIASYAFAAIVIAHGAMIASVVGLLMALIPLIGALWATVTIVFVCTLIVAVLIWLIKRKLRTLRMFWRRRHDG